MDTRSIEREDKWTREAYKVHTNQGGTAEWARIDGGSGSSNIKRGHSMTSDTSHPQVQVCAFSVLVCERVQRQI